MTFEWTDDLITGDTEIDTHHQAFFSKIQRLWVAAHLGRGESEVRSAVEFLREYGVHHFAAEEARMHESNFPYARSHKEAHAQFLAQMDETQKRIDAGDDLNEVAGALAQFAVGWFRHHIKNADFLLMDHLRGESPELVGE